MIMMMIMMIIFGFLIILARKKTNKLFIFTKNTRTPFEFSICIVNLMVVKKKINKGIIDDHDQLDNLISMMMMMIFKTS